MRPVGIIANPNSGKDIRRIVACGSVFDNNEKARILKRAFLAMDALGIEEVLIMPDTFGIGRQALEDLDLRLRPVFLDMEVTGGQDDSTAAARIMTERGAACIITLGGDGTNRVVAKTCGEVPLVPISTGTNNVFPRMIEGTIAGMAAAGVAVAGLPAAQTGIRMPRLELYDRENNLLDIALIDVVVSDHCFSGSRALYDETTLHEIFLSRVEPGHIGFSSVAISRMVSDSYRGMAIHLTIGEGGGKVLAPVAPGVVRWIPVHSFQVLEPYREVAIAQVPSFIALDGERELRLGEGESISVLVSERGPYVVDVSRALYLAGNYVEPAKNN